MSASFPAHPPARPPACSPARLLARPPAAPLLACACPPGLYLPASLYLRAGLLTAGSTPLPAEEGRPEGHVLLDNEVGLGAEYNGRKRPISERPPPPAKRPAKPKPR